MKILRRHTALWGIPSEFAIYDRGDQESWPGSVCARSGRAGVAMRPGDLLFQISSWKNQSLRPAQAASKRPIPTSEHLAAMAYRRYQQALRNAGAVDFDDLLLLTEELLHRTFPACDQQRPGDSTIC